MAETAASTAYGPMLMVAFEQVLPPEQRIIDDPYAYQILPLYMKLMVKACTFGPLRKGLFNLLDKQTPGLLYAFACRKRYIEDTVMQALDQDFDSLVILGAGLDTLAYRLPQLAAMPVYEVDLPENIQYKREKLEALFGSVPEHVTLVPVDFETQRLDQALDHAGYAFDQKTFFIWEAVTQYLTEDAVREMFQGLAKAQTGSRLIFTYVRQDFLTGENKDGLESLHKRMVDNNVWRFGLDPDSVDDFLREYGWGTLDHLGEDTLANRYMKPVGRLESMSQIERIVYAEKSGV